MFFKNIFNVRIIKLSILAFFVYCGSETSNKENRDEQPEPFLNKNDIDKLVKINIEIIQKSYLFQEKFCKIFTNKSSNSKKKNISENIDVKNMNSTKQIDVSEMQNLKYKCTKEIIIDLNEILKDIIKLYKLYCKKADIIKYKKIKYLNIINLNLCARDSKNNLDDYFLYHITNLWKKIKGKKNLKIFLSESFCNKLHDFYVKIMLDSQFLFFTSSLDYLYKPNMNNYIKNEIINYSELFSYIEEDILYNYSNLDFAIYLNKQNISCSNNELEKQYTPSIHDGILDTEKNNNAKNLLYKILRKENDINNLKNKNCSFGLFGPERIILISSKTNETSNNKTFKSFVLILDKFYTYALDLDIKIDSSLYYTINTIHCILYMITDIEEIYGKNNLNTITSKIYELIDVKIYNFMTKVHYSFFNENLDNLKVLENSLLNFNKILKYLSANVSKEMIQKIYDLLKKYSNDYKNYEFKYKNKYYNLMVYLYNLVYKFHINKEDFSELLFCDNSVNLILSKQINQIKSTLITGNFRTCKCEIKTLMHIYFIKINLFYHMKTKGIIKIENKDTTFDKICEVFSQYIFLTIQKIYKKYDPKHKKKSENHDELMSDYTNQYDVVENKESNMISGENDNLYELEDKKNKIKIDLYDENKSSAIKNCETIKNNNIYVTNEYSKTSNILNKKELPANRDNDYDKNIEFFSENLHPEIIFIINMHNFYETHVFTQHKQIEIAFKRIKKFSYKYLSRIIKSLNLSLDRFMDYLNLRYEIKTVMEYSENNYNVMENYIKNLHGLKNKFKKSEFVFELFLTHQNFFLSVDEELTEIIGIKDDLICDSLDKILNFLKNYKNDTDEKEQIYLLEHTHCVFLVSFVYKKMIPNISDDNKRGLNIALYDEYLSDIYSSKKLDIFENFISSYTKITDQSNEILKLDEYEIFDFKMDNFKINCSDVFLSVKFLYDFIYLLYLHESKDFLYNNAVKNQLKKIKSISFHPEYKLGYKIEVFNKISDKICSIYNKVTNFLNTGIDELTVYMIDKILQKLQKNPDNIKLNIYVIFIYNQFQVKNKYFTFLEIEEYQTILRKIYYKYNKDIYSFRNLELFLYNLSNFYDLVNYRIFKSLILFIDACKNDSKLLSEKANNNLAINTQKKLHSQYSLHLIELNTNIKCLITEYNEILKNSVKK